ncbi:hypothetical protein FO519_009235 [Halicephalobus sp. NKZ332]|nr:hypothetical protein FO519_009235 [Halicephalobus sp. NKZ332]
MSVRSRFNSDDGLSALFSWPSITSTPRTLGPVPDSGLQMGNPPTACKFHIILEGKNESIVVDRVFEKDESEGILLRDLEYSTEYILKMRTIVTEEGASPGTLETSFRSLSCPEVHGKGSLECEPEPVENLTVILHPGNSSAFVSWTHAVDPSNVLIYQLVYSTLDQGCGDFQSSVYLNPTKMNTTISLPGSRECDFQVQVISFDPFGREAETSSSFHFAPSTQTLPLFWVVLGPATVLLFLCTVLQCVRCCCLRGSRKKVGELAKTRGPENV